MNKAELIAASPSFYLEGGLLIGMLVTLLIPSQAVPVMVWNEIPVLSYFRGFLWLLGLSILPGLYLLRLTGVSDDLSQTAKIAIGMNLSFAFVGIVTLVAYYARIDALQLQCLFLSALGIMASVYWIKFKKRSSAILMKMDKSHLVLMLECLVIVLVAFSIQWNKQYLIPGDNWVSLKPAVAVLSGRGVYESFRTVEYPVIFGFMLAGLSVGGGLPVVNVYVLLFPLAALNIISFFALVKTVFNLGDKLSVLSTVIYGLCGGLGWLIQVLVYQGTRDFWGVSLTTQDMYFSVFFWSSIQFSYKSLAITLAYGGIIAFAICLKRDNRKVKIASAIISSLLILFSFLVHMIDAVMLAPVILAIAYFHQKGRDRYVWVGILLAAIAVIGYFIDYLMSGFYSSLAAAKAQLFLSTINVSEILAYSTLSTVIVVIIILLRHMLIERQNPGFVAKYSRILKRITVISLFGLYVGGLFVWSSIPVGDLSAGFPWYRYVTRYGFVGGLALVGAAMVSWKKKWFLITVFWGIVAIAMGSIWWGERTNGYLFPMVAILAAVAIDEVWKKSKESTLRFFAETERLVTKEFKIRLKHVAAALIILVLALSMASVMWGAYYYTFTEHPTDDDSVRVFSWVSQHSPQNSTIFVPNVYIISKGIYTISDRQIYESSGLPTTLDAESFVNITSAIYENDVRYAVTTESAPEQSTILKYLLSYSNVAFRTGNITVYEIPQLHPPSSQFSVATVSKEPLGLREANATFGWVDDAFTNNWTHQNVNASSDGEVLTFSWQFQTGSIPEPSMKRDTPATSTNTYHYLIVKYRNTPETSTTAQNVYQIITLYNQTGSTKGFVKNIYLPVATTTGFNLVSYRLPENQSIASISIWMRNAKNLTGTAEIQIDYLGLSSTDTVNTAEYQIGFLKMAMPALWPTNYAIVSDFNETANATTIISTFDNSTPDLIGNATTAQTFVFLNSTVNVPSWGTEWKQIQNNIISGYFDGKKVLIIGVNPNSGNISVIAQTIYQEITR